MSADLPINEREALEVSSSQAAFPIIDGFEILSLLGIGGMSTVYKARQIALGRTVAIKVLSKSLVYDSSQIQRFLREAKLSTRLEHPNIASVFACGTSDEHLPFLVMEYVEGETLKQLLQRQGTLNTEQIKDIFGQLCKALTHAHENNVVHRDLKPANVMLVANGERTLVKVLDFGIAKILEPDNHDAQKLTRTGQIIGSPVYMSPEQCTGHQLDQRSDVYSVGCMLYQAIAGKPPYAGENALQVAAKHVSESARALSDVVDYRVPKALEKIVAKAMAKQPQQRFQTAAQLNDELQTVVPVSSDRRFHRRKPWSKKVSAVTAALLALGVVALAYCFEQTSLQQSNQNLSRADQLLNKGDYLKAFGMIRSLNTKPLSDADADKLVNDLLDIARMLDEDQVPNDQVGFPGEWDAGSRVCTIAMDPCCNHPSAFALCKALAIRIHLTSSWHRVRELLDHVDVRGLSEKDRHYCLSWRDQLRALNVASDFPPDLAQARACFRSAIEHAKASGHTGRLLGAWITFGDFQFGCGQIAASKECMDAAYAAIGQGINSHDLETAGALVRLGRMALDSSSSLYNPSAAVRALESAEGIYATRCGSKTAMAELYMGQAAVANLGGDTNRALTLYTKAAAENAPAATTAEALVGEAVSFQQAGKPGQAIAPLEVVVEECLETKMRRKGLVIYAPVLLANLYAMSGRADEALKLYDKCLAFYHGQQLRYPAVRQGIEFYQQLRK